MRGWAGGVFLGAARQQAKQACPRGSPTARRASRNHPGCFLLPATPTPRPHTPFFQSVLVSGKPHMGTENLVRILKNFRAHLQVGSLRRGGGRGTGPTAGCRSCGRRKDRPAARRDWRRQTRTPFCLALSPQPLHPARRSA
jgi:hypothetical protein